MAGCWLLLLGIDRDQTENALFMRSKSDLVAKGLPYRQFLVLKKTVYYVKFTLQVLSFCQHLGMHCNTLVRVMNALRFIEILIRHPRERENIEYSASVLWKSRDS